MRKKPLPSMALAIILTTASHAQFADSVASYTPGSGVGANFTNPAAALGEPSRVNPFGESVDPFNPPYGTNQVVSLGAGGSLTLRLDRPILNDPSHPFGVDFIVFGNAGFVITNGDFSGGGVTDGSLFGDNLGATRLSVSLDNVTYYRCGERQLNLCSRCRTVISPARTWRGFGPCMPGPEAGRVSTLPGRRTPTAAA